MYKTLVYTLVNG